MFLKCKLLIALGLLPLMLWSCSSETIKPTLTLSEQIEVDTKHALAVSEKFQQDTAFIEDPQAVAYLESVATKLLKQKKGYETQKVTIKIHRDSSEKNQRFYSFPGIFISVPISFLKRVEFENELASSLAFEIANVINRFLALKIESGAKAIFDLNHDERKASIRAATEILYHAGYDTRGMASIFRRYAAYYTHEISFDLTEKEVDFNVREAQRAKSDFLPQMRPTVRSTRFIKFKKDLSVYTKNIN